MKNVCHEELSPNSLYMPIAILTGVCPACGKGWFRYLQTHQSSAPKGDGLHTSFLVQADLLGGGQPAVEGGCVRRRRDRPVRRFCQPIAGSDGSGRAGGLDFFGRDHRPQ